MLLVNDHQASVGSAGVRSCSFEPVWASDRHGGGHRSKRDLAGPSLAGTAPPVSQPINLRRR
jgi:hypothetical protein